MYLFLATSSIFLMALSLILQNGAGANVMIANGIDGSVLRRKDGKRAPYGEIDVVEMFGSKKESNHNIHTQYTLDNPKHGLRTSFKHEVDVTKWHVYGIEWTPEYVKWLVDGQQVGIYYKSSDKELLQKHQWTFDDKFFILLNQSVGNGAYGLIPDITKTYETKFDWIRVYQKK